ATWILVIPLYIISLKHNEMNMIVYAKNYVLVDILMFIGCISSFILFIIGYFDIRKTITYTTDRFKNILFLTFCITVLYSIITFAFNIWSFIDNYNVKNECRLNTDIWLIHS